MSRIAMLLLIQLVWVPAAAADEVIHLVDKTRIVGRFLHFYDGLLSIKVASGATMRLPQSKVRRIEFKLPKPRAELSTPKKAFARLRKAALRGDIEAYVDAHSAYYQMFLGHQIEQVGPRKFTTQLQKEWNDVQLEVIGAEIKGDTAILKVRRRSGLQKEEGEFRFVKENKEWKMILPL